MSSVISNIKKKLGIPSVIKGYKNDGDIYRKEYINRARRRQEQLDREQDIAMNKMSQKEYINFINKQETIGGASSYKKRSNKKRSSKKRSTRKRSTKKRSSKKRSTRKRSTKKRSSKKRSTRKRSSRKRSTRKRSAKKRLYKELSIKKR